MKGLWRFTLLLLVLLPIAGVTTLGCGGQSQPGGMEAVEPQEMPPQEEGWRDEEGLEPSGGP